MPRKLRKIGKKRAAHIQDKAKPNYDPEKHRKKERERYRRTSPDFELKDLSYTLQFMDPLGKTLPIVLPSGELREFKTFDIPTTAKVLQRPYPTLWRYIDRGQIPPPVFKTHGLTKNKEVYISEEVRVFVEELAKHELEVKYFRTDHVHVIDAIHDKVDIIRKSLT